MMLTAISLTLSFLGVEAPLWAKLDNLVSLFDTLKVTGPGAQTSGDSCVILDSSGKVVKRIRFDKTSAPLYLNDQDVLVTSPLSFLNDNSTNQPIWGAGSFGNCFAQGKYVFAIGSGAVLLGNPPLALPSYDHLAAVGINTSGDRLALMTRPMSAACMSIYVNNGNEWHAESNVRTPEIERSGLVSVLPRFNDLRFISKNVCAFIGKTVGPQNGTELAKAEGEMMDLTTPPLETVRGIGSPCYLFLTDIRDGWTRGVARMSYAASPERGGPRTGRMAVSSDQKLLYIAVEGGVIKLSTD
ncbi:MAG: hypothetical protein H7Y17_09120, partial [Chlorobia bacterium]|nr:hypothetical protein [Fimbriimonadaceae bacterium]